jgi:16S rRNA (adenine1518-N6/adenine1519-N6)-dimethyltransferase
VVRARKRFGQNFLTDETVALRIASAVALAPTDRLLEIGPGRGALTEVLYPSDVARYVAVEIDRDLIALLAGTFPRLELLNADVLRVALREVLAGVDWSVVGNLPYNISTPLLVRLFAHSGLIRDMHFMLQREVAQRLAAVPGTKQWGRLSVLAQYHCQIELLFEVPPESFTPAPKVHSCVVRFVPRAPQHAADDLERLQLVLRHAFSGRRKRIANALRSLAIRWEDLALPADARADQLSVEDYVALANACTTIGDEG